MTEKCFRLIFRARRKLGRELRKRALPLYRLWYRRGLNAATSKQSPKELLLCFGDLAPWAAGDGNVPGFEEWATPDEATAIIRLAQKVCDHRLDLLGSGDVHLGEEIDWHLDFKAGHRFPPDEHHLNIRWDTLPAGVDIKVPWELSRCQHFAALGFADWLTGSDQYYEGFKEQVRSWIGSNPYGRGVNWVCAMDVAIRAVNWLNAAMMFRHRIGDDDDEQFFGELIESLWMHGRHVMGNLEWQGPRSKGLGNHFLADLVGLLALGVLFAETGVGRGYRSFASQWLEGEVTRQVFGDGVLHETSTSYHRLSSELFLWASTLSGCFGEPLSTDYGERVHRMADFTGAYTSPSGYAAQFGDNDSGRLLSAGIDDSRDHRYLTRLECGFGGRANRLLLRGETSPLGPVGESRADFPEGGFWFLRSGAAWMGVRGGVISHNGAHAHCDQLSFVLAVDHEDLIIDPGTFVYTPDPPARNRYRSTGAHNACQLNGWEANEMRDDKMGLFLLRDNTETEVTERSDAGGSSRIVGRHHGYERFREGCAYERSLALSPESLEIRDRFGSVRSGDSLDWRLCFAPGIQLRIADGVVVAATKCRELRIVLGTGMEPEISRGRCSPAYGVEEDCFMLSLRKRVSDEHEDEHSIRVEWTNTENSHK